MEDSKDTPIPQSMLDMLSEKEEGAVLAFKQNLTMRITRKEKEVKAKRKRLQKLTMKSKKRNRQ